MVGLGLRQNFDAGPLGVDAVEKRLPVTVAVQAVEYVYISKQGIRPSELRISQIDLKEQMQWVLAVDTLGYGPFFNTLRQPAELMLVTALGHVGRYLDDKASVSNGLQHASFP
jgi:hypothetical protein